MKLAIIAAIGENRELGLKNKLLWHISDDLKRFKRITSGHTVIMGRKTFESLNCRPLPNRRNIVLTKQNSDTVEGAEFVFSVGEALAKVENEDIVFIIGGGMIYQTFLPLSDMLYLTLVHSTFRADTYFPDIPPEEWEETEHSEVKEAVGEGVKYSYVIMHRKP